MGELLRNRRPHLVAREEEIHQRLLQPMINETARLLADGVTDSTETIGLDRIVEQMDHMTSRHGPRFEPVEALRLLAAERLSMQEIGSRYHGGPACRRTASRRCPLEWRKLMMVRLSETDRQQFEKAKDLMESGAAGDDGFLKSLFFGRLRLDKVLPYPLEDPQEVPRTESLLNRLESFLDQHVDPDRIDSEQVLSALRRPIENFGRLSAFARHEWRDVIVGARCDGLDPKLRDEAAMLVRLTKQLARDVSRLLARHRQHIVDMQLLHQRIAWSAIELFTTAAVLSRLQSALERADAETGDRTHQQLVRDLMIGKGYCRHAADRIRRRLKGLFHNRDQQRLSLADAVFGDVPHPFEAEAN